MEMLVLDSVSGKIRRITLWFVSICLFRSEIVAKNCFLLVYDMRNGSPHEEFFYIAVRDKIHLHNVHQMDSFN